MNINDMKVLICDDSILSRKKLKDYIASLGCGEIYEATDGEDAVAKYKEFHPDLVFMDIVMPKKDGIGAITEILEEDKNAKVVMASSVGTQSFLKDAIKAGAYDFLQKPLNNELVKRIITNISTQGGN